VLLNPSLHVQLTAEDYDLPTFAPKLRELVRIVSLGRGFQLLKCALSPLLRIPHLLFMPAASQNRSSSRPSSCLMVPHLTSFPSKTPHVLQHYNEKLETFGERPVRPRFNWEHHIGVPRIVRIVTVQLLLY